MIKYLKILALSSMIAIPTTSAISINSNPQAIEAQIKHHTTFETYDNTEQQNVHDKYALNKKSRKIHKPKCRTVKRIAPKNYCTSNKTLKSLSKKGYSLCGVCFNTRYNA